MLLQGCRLVWQVRSLSLIRTSLTPHKFTSGRHKFPGKRCRVTNRAEYNESLRQRGNLTVRITGDAPGQWRAPRRSTPGGQPEYSEFAIATCLTPRTIYKLPLRQTQELMRSIAQLMGVEIQVPDFSTSSRRGRGLTAPRQEIHSQRGLAMLLKSSSQLRKTLCSPRVRLMIRPRETDTSLRYGPTGDWPGKSAAVTISVVVRKHKLVVGKAWLERNRDRGGSKIRKPRHGLACKFSTE